MTGRAYLCDVTPSTLARQPFTL